MMLPAEAFPDACASEQSADLPKLSAEGQAEADARFQMVLSRYGNRLSDEEKHRTKALCYSLQTTLEHVRAYPIKNGDVPALFLRPLIDRQEHAPEILADEAEHHELRAGEGALALRTALVAGAGHGEDQPGVGDVRKPDGGAAGWLRGRKMPPNCASHALKPYRFAPTSVSTLDIPYYSSEL
jgi:hypothetical protein